MQAPHLDLPRSHFISHAADVWADERNLQRPQIPAIAYENPGQTIGSRSRILRATLFKRDWNPSYPKQWHGATGRALGPFDLFVQSRVAGNQQRRTRSVRRTSRDARRTGQRTNSV